MIDQSLARDLDLAQKRLAVKVALDAYLPQVDRPLETLADITAEVLQMAFMQNKYDYDHAESKAKTPSIRRHLLLQSMARILMLQETVQQWREIAIKTAS